MGAGESETIEQALAAIASPERGEAAGFTSGLACAQAAALLELTAALAARRLGSEAMDELAASAERLRGEALEVARLERTAYADARASGRWELAVEPARRAKALAVEISRGSAAVTAAGEWPFTPDARAAGMLADTAGGVADLILAANEEATGGA